MAAAVGHQTQLSACFIAVLSCICIWQVRMQLLWIEQESLMFTNKTFVPVDPGLGVIKPSLRLELVLYRALNPNKPWSQIIFRFSFRCCFIKHTLLISSAHVSPLHVFVSLTVELNGRKEGRVLLAKQKLLFMSVLFEYVYIGFFFSIFLVF